MLEKLRLAKFRLTYFSVSAFLMSCYSLYEGEKGLAVFLVVAGVAAIVVDLLTPDHSGLESDTLNES